jgi:hypothetical protein
MVPVAVVCLALRAPSIWWSSGIVALFLLAWLSSVLVAVYRSGQVRAMAVGFCIFSSGFLAVEGALWTISSGALSLPTHEWVRWSFDKFHRRKVTPGGNDPFGSPTVAADDPFAPDSVSERFTHFKTICIATLAFVGGAIGASIAQVLERTRKRLVVP